MKRKHYTFLIINVIAVMVLVSCSNSSAGENSNSQTDSESTPTESGSLDIAFAADPETLDWMYTGASATRDVGWHIFETLLALDDDYEIKPMIRKIMMLVKMKKNIRFIFEKEFNFMMERL